MAKAFEGLPGSSGHIHVSLTDLEGKNLFARETTDPNAQWPDLAHVSQTGRSFLAGLIDALPDIMPLLVPNINSYKRLVESYWAPVTLGWGLEDRLSSIRLVAPPICKPSATRFEVRIPGADLHPHYALAAIFRAGWRGVEKNMGIALPPTALRCRDDKPALLPNSLHEAVKRFEAKDSIARELMGDEFVDAYALSRHHELRVWREAVTDW
jgi:glutamine synthetase